MAKFCKPAYVKVKNQFHQMQYQKILKNDQSIKKTKKMGQISDKMCKKKKRPPRTLIHVTGSCMELKTAEVEKWYDKGIET